MKDEHRSSHCCSTCARLCVVACARAHSTHKHIMSHSQWGANIAPSLPTTGFSVIYSHNPSFFSFRFSNLLPHFCTLPLVRLFSTSIKLWFSSSRIQWCRLFWGRRWREFYFDLKNRDWWSLLRLRSREKDDIFSVSQVCIYLFCQSKAFLR